MANHSISYKLYRYYHKEAQLDPKQLQQAVQISCKTLCDVVVCIPCIFINMKEKHTLEEIPIPNSLHIKRYNTYNSLHYIHTSTVQCTYVQYSVHLYICLVYWYHLGKEEIR